MTVLALAVIIPLAVNTGAYKGDFTYAYNAYEDVKQADKSTGVTTSFKSGTVTETVDDTEAFIRHMPDHPLRSPADQRRKGIRQAAAGRPGDGVTACPILMF